MKHPTIDQPSLLTRKHRQLAIFFTLIFWTLWFSLWIPVINLGAWMAGYELFWSPMAIFPTRHQLFVMITWHVLVICLIPFILGLWVLYNLMKFGNNNRRRTSQLPISRTEIASHFGVEEKDLSHWQKAKRLTVHMDEVGNITRVKAGRSAKTD